MKKLSKQITTLVIFLSVIYVCYINYINLNGIIIGTEVIKTEENQYKIGEMTETSYGKFVGLKQGDLIVKINKEKPSEKNLKGNNLYHIRSLDVMRDGKLYYLEDFDIVNLNGSYSYFLTVLPLVFYCLSLVCIFYVLKVSKIRKSFAGYVLILFLLDVAIAYMSAGGPARGHEFNRYINLFTFISSPIFYLRFIQEYFKELGKKFANSLVSFLYIIPILNIGIEFFHRHFPQDFITNLNLVSFFFVTVTGFILVFFHLYKYKYSEHAYILKILILTNTLSFAPFFSFLCCSNDSDR